MASTLKITQVRSAIRQTGRQKRTLQALGLRRMHQTVVHNDTPQIRGMIERVSHLVRLEIDADGNKPAARTSTTGEAEKVEAGAAAAAEKPGAGKPAAKKPAVKKPAVKKPAAKKTAAKKTAAKKKVKKKPTVKKTTAKKPPAKKSAAKKSATTKGEDTED